MKCVLALLLPVVALAQPPVVAWLKLYGGPNADAGQTGQPTFDNGYIFVGTTSSFGAGGTDVWLLKLDRNGDTVWTRTYGGDDTEIVWTVAELYDGGYAIAGWSHSYNGRPYGHVFVARTDADGDSVWVRTYGGPYSDFGISIQETMDSCLVIAGYYGTGPGLGVDGYVLKLDINGDTIWTRRFGGSRNDGLSWIDCTPDRGYIVSGATYSFGAGMADVWMIKLDSLGNQEWLKLYGWERDDGSRGITPVSDGYIVVGQCDATGWETSDIWVLKTDFSGDTVWAWIYGDDNEWDKAFLAWETGDGGLVVFGETESYEAQDRDFLAVKFESAMGTTGSRGPYRMEPTSPTVVRGVLYAGHDRNPPSDFGSCPKCVLLDVSGRKVLDLKPGANDVRHLCPGVYFLRSAVSSQPSAVTKVVVTR